MPRRLPDRSRDPVGEADVLRMRRAYYAVTSHIDAKIGRLLDTLNAIGAAEDTMVVFTSDHGDSLGERGLFFKMSFVERSARAPPILHAPFAFAPRAIRNGITVVALQWLCLNRERLRTAWSGRCARLRKRGSSVGCTDKRQIDFRTNLYASPADRTCPGFDPGGEPGIGVARAPCARGSGPWIVAPRTAVRGGPRRPGRPDGVSKEWRSRSGPDPQVVTGAGNPR